MKDLKVYIAIASIFLTVYLIAQYNRPKPVNWKESFDKADKIPYGTYIIYNQLRKAFPGSPVRVERRAPYLTFTEGGATQGSYLIIAKSVNVDKYDFRELEKFMRGGSDVFIASYFPGNFLTDSLKIKINSERAYNDGKKTSLNFTSPSLHLQKDYRFDKGIGEQYFSEFDTAHAVVLGMNNRGHANFLKYQFGKGALYLLAGPHFFTNYNMLRPDGAEYAAKTLSYLRPGGEVIWDEFSSLGKEEEGSLMKVFIHHRQLKIAWYLTILSMLFFVLYEIKRRQRIIPVIEPLKNTTAEFVGQVGRVYYERKDHSDIAHKKVRYLLEYIRSKYNLKMENPDKEFAELLTAKSELDYELVENLVLQIAQVMRYPNVTERELIELNQTIESFYKKSQ